MPSSRPRSRRTRPSASRTRPHVVTGRDQVDAEVVGPLQERAELDLTVAPRARVRRPPRRVLGDEVRDHRPVEGRRQVHDLEREPGDAGDLGGVGARGRPAAPVLDVVEVDEAHVRADHLVALLLQQARGHRRIDAAGHGDQDGGAHASRLAPASGPDGLSWRTMIEARFDDLTPGGASFRLVGPVGVFEARRPDEVADVLEAAESSAQRGLWVGGFVAYEAAPGLDPPSRSAPRARRPDGRPAARLVRAVRRARGDPAARAPQGDARPGRRLAALRRPPEVRRRHRGDPRADRRGRHLPGEPHPAAPVDRRRRHRGLYRDLCFSQRGAYGAYLNAGRYLICPASPELFFELDGDGRDPADEGHRAARSPRPRTTAIARAGSRSPKDRAENAMIVDLLRNDLGASPVPAASGWRGVFAAERYETVWQLTSTVSSELAPEPVSPRSSARCSRAAR